MTPEQAAERLLYWIKKGKPKKDDQCGYIEGWFNKRDEEAFIMATEALQRLKRIDNRFANAKKTDWIRKGFTDEEVKDICDEARLNTRNTLQTEPCEDVVSRTCDKCTYYCNGANDEACDGCFAEEYEHPNFRKADVNNVRSGLPDLIERQAAIETFADMRDGYPKFIGEMYEDAVIAKFLKRLPSVNPVCKSCEDAISRQAAIDKLTLLRDKHNPQGNDYDNALYATYDIAIDEISGLPQIQSSQKVGRWLHKEGVHGVAYCSECDFELRMNDTKYCPNCGSYNGGA